MFSPLLNKRLKEVMQEDDAEFKQPTPQDLEKQQRFNRLRDLLSGKN